MAMIHRALSVLALGLVVTAGVSPALAKGRAQAGYNDGGGYPVTARVAALRKCSAREARYTEYLWGSIEVEIYRACMAEKGQRE